VWSADEVQQEQMKKRAAREQEIQHDTKSCITFQPSCASTSRRITAISSPVDMIEKADTIEHLRTAVRKNKGHSVTPRGSGAQAVLLARLIICLALVPCHIRRQHKRRILTFRLWG
jgi:hypothetical protein